MIKKGQPSSFRENTLVVREEKQKKLSSHRGIAIRGS